MIFEFIMDVIGGALSLVTETLPKIAWQTLGIGWISDILGHWVRLGTLLSVLSTILTIEGSIQGWKASNWLYEKIRG